MADSKISALPSSSTPLAGSELVPIVQSGATKKVAVSDLTAGRDVAAKSFKVGGTGTGAIYSPTPINCGAGVFSVGAGSNSATGKGPGCAYSADAAGNMNVYRGFWWQLGANDEALLILGNSTADAFNAPITVSTDTNVKINTGNLIQGTAAKGVNFTANTPAAGMTSQLLNWYEEGTWTVVIEGSTSAGTATYTTQTGKYVRIGSCVTVIGKVGYSSHTGTGTMKITGLPFTSLSDGLYSTFVIDAANLTIPANSIAVVETNPNTTYLTVGSITTGAVGVTALAMDAAASLYFQATYFV